MIWLVQHTYHLNQGYRRDSNMLEIIRAIKDYISALKKHVRFQLSLLCLPGCRFSNRFLFFSVVGIDAIV